jgi:hypothetical protein
MSKGEGRLIMQTKIKVGKYILLILPILIITACNFPTFETPPILPTLSADIDTAEPVPLATHTNECALEETEPIDTLAPSEGSVLDILQPTFSWSDPNSCIPRIYRVLISEHPDMDDAIGGYVNGEILQWTIEEPLSSAHQYWWQVLPLYVLVEGSPEGELIEGKPSQIKTFFTGPLCEEAELTAPVLLRPPEGDVVAPRKTVATDLPLLDWDFQTACLPDKYQVLISRQIDVEPPLTVDHYTTDTRSEWQLDIDLEEDTQYFWKVAAIRGNARGPFSESQSFATNAIDENLPGLLDGRIWEDICDNPPDRVYDPDEGPLPSGCVNLEGYVLGNGEFEPGEQPLQGIHVEIGEGACPDLEDPIELITDRNGFYHIFLPSGTYCIHIDPFDTENRSLLLPGAWSSPVLSDKIYVTETIELPGQIRPPHDFGWDFDESGPGSVGGLSGRVWNDLNADGVFQGDEPGIEGLELWLYKESCDLDLPSTDPRVISTMRSDNRGWYGLELGGRDAEDWGNLEAGAYCVLVHPLDHEYGSVLGRGQWTQPPIEGDGPSITIDLPAGEYRSDINFGWHFPPYLIADRNANCRYGPGTVYPTIGYINEGIRKWIEGHNPNTTWLGVRMSDEDECWVADSIVSVFGDLEETNLWPIPPTPIPPDTTPPDLNISHSPVAVDISDVVTFTANASDDRGVERIVIKVKAPGSGSFSTVKDCSSSTCVVSGGPYDKGTLEYFAIAWDEAGNEARTSTKSVIVEDPYL